MKQIYTATLVFLAHHRESKAAAHAVLTSLSLEPVMSETHTR